MSASAPARPFGCMIVFTQGRGRAEEEAFTSATEAARKLGLVLYNERRRRKTADVQIDAIPHLTPAASLTIRGIVFRYMDHQWRRFRKDSVCSHGDDSFFLSRLRVELAPDFRRDVLAVLASPASYIECRPPQEAVTPDAGGARQ